uniref:EF-hand domain-containing protein n=1 Tax=Solanum lycopersicum TaxID=4081 RepID=K4AVY1_SOLLC
MIDTDSSGTLTYEELKDGLKKVGSDLGELDIKAMMKAADFDNSGMIDYSEFIAATLHLNKMDRERRICLLHSPTSTKMAVVISQLMSFNRLDGRIDYGEFATMMKKGNTRFAARTMRDNLNFNLADAHGASDSEKKQ